MIDRPTWIPNETSASIMKVSDLNPEDRKEALIVRMEIRDEDGLIFLDEIIRDKNGPTLREGEMVRSTHKKWFLQ